MKKMKQRLKIEVIVNYDNLLQKKNIVVNDAKHNIAEIEGAVLDEVAEAINKAVNCSEVNICIEEFKERKVEGFERSSKMGSKAKLGWTFQVH
jgi:hypothetical protein